MALAVSPQTAQTHNTSWTVVTNFFVQLKFYSVFCSTNVSSYDYWYTVEPLNKMDTFGISRFVPYREDVLSSEVKIILV